MLLAIALLRLSKYLMKTVPGLSAPQIGSPASAPARAPLLVLAAARPKGAPGTGEPSDALSDCPAHVAPVFRLRKVAKSKKSKSSYGWRTCSRHAIHLTFGQSGEHTEASSGPTRRPRFAIESRVHHLEQVTNLL